MAINFKSFINDIKSGAGKAKRTYGGAVDAVKNFKAAADSNKKSKKNIEEYVRKRMQKENAGSMGREEAQKQYVKRIKKEKKKFNL